MRLCEAHYYTGLRAGQPCDKPAKTWLAGNVQMAVCGRHRLGYVREIFRLLRDQRRSRMIKTNAFLVIRPSHRFNGQLQSVTIDRLTRNKPGLKSTEVAIELSLMIDEHLFEQYMPKIEVELSSPGQLIIPKIVIPEQIPAEDNAEEDPDARPY